MKIHAILVTILMLLAQLSTAQNYLDSTSRWTIVERSGSIGAPHYNYRAIHYQQFFDGDTLINGKKFYKMYEGPKLDTIKNASQNIYHDTIYPVKFKAYIREDSGKIYAGAIVFHDFTLEIGDTLPLILSNNPSNISGCDTVYSIDTIYLGGNPRKRYNGDIIEGIGSGWGGIFERYCPITGSRTSSICYEQQGVTIFSTVTDPNDCQISLGTKQLEATIESNKITISPNPFQKQTTLSFENSIKQPYQLSIFDALGKKVHQQGNIVDQQVTIHRNNLSKGIYFFNVLNKDQQLIKTGKLMIVD